jgi:hypothetical protein
LLAGLIAAVAISTLALGVAAFVLSIGRRSFVMAGLLAGAGVAFAVPAIIAMGDFSAIAVPGPIFGVIFGMVVLGLGAAKGAASAGSEKGIQT